MIIDKPLAELEQYKPSLTRQQDFDAFWEQTLNESADQPLNATLHELAYPVERVTVYRVSYDGFGPATRIAGWYLVPKDRYRNGCLEKSFIPDPLKVAHFVKTLHSF